MEFCESEEMFMKMKKMIPVIIFLIFAVAGIGMIIGSFTMLKMEKSITDGAVEITAHITDIQSHRDSDGDMDYDVFVSYEYDGVMYEDRKINSYSSNMYIGEELTLLYNPLHPAWLTVKGSERIGFYIMFSMGTVFFLVGISCPIYWLIARAKTKRILNAGYVLHATVDSITYNTSVTMNGRNPFVIYCSYYDPMQNLTYRFKSDNLWTDPGYVFQPGDPIEVAVNPNNYKHYHVKAEERINQRVVDYT